MAVDSTPGLVGTALASHHVSSVFYLRLDDVEREVAMSLGCCLARQVRYLGLAEPEKGGVAAFINKALTPPGEAALNNALTLLTRIGALRTDESLTPLVRAGTSVHLFFFVGSAVMLALVMPLPCSIQSLLSGSGFLIIFRSSAVT